MSITAVAKKLDVSRGTVYRMVGDGRLRAVTLPHLRKGRLVIVAESVDELMRSGQPPADAR